MIVRILGEGQYDVDDAHAELLNGLDSGLERAVESGDEDAVPGRARRRCSAQVRTDRRAGCRTTRWSPRTPSCPTRTQPLDEVRALLADSSEGLIPG